MKKAIISAALAAVTLIGIGSAAQLTLLKLAP